MARFATPLTIFRIALVLVSRAYSWKTMERKKWKLWWNSLMKKTFTSLNSCCCVASTGLAGMSLMRSMSWTIRDSISW